MKREEKGDNSFAGGATNVVQASKIFGGVQLAPGEAMPVPRQLPRAPTYFTDRADVMARLSEIAATDNGIAVVSGPAGVGKSALAVFWAHGTRDRYPDGQLYVDLRGYDHRPPLRPEDVIRNFLYSLNAPANRIPDELDAMCALFRSLLHDKRLLLVADNANNAEQVRPLLPSSATCFTIVTSRSRLGSLVAVDGAVPLPVMPLETDEAVRLFAKLSGHTDREGAARLVLSCGRLPLTIRIAAQQTSGTADLAELLEELKGDGALAAFATPDEGTKVHAVFSWSYQTLSPSAARAFRLLALHAGPHFSVEAAAALIGVPMSEARRVLRALEAVNMLEEIERRRYRYHDLLRDYARERAMEEETAAGTASAVHRELSYYLRMADAADRVLAPERRHVPIPEADEAGGRPFKDPAAALAWCDSELSSLIPAVDQAYQIGFDEFAWKLPVALVYFLRLRQHHHHRLHLSTTAVQAAGRAGDRSGETWSLICLGGVESDLGRHEEAIGHFAEASRISGEIGDLRWQSISAYNMGRNSRLLGRTEEAREYQRQALAIQRECGDRRSESITLTELGALALTSGHPRQAHDDYLSALAVARETADLYTEGECLHGLGDVCRRLGRSGEALEWYERAVEVRRQVGDLAGYAYSLFDVARLYVESGRSAAAQQLLDIAIGVFDDLQNPFGQQVRDYRDANTGGMS
ncbi:ATP-binding protein [Microbispora rosea]|uniref:ATP-binding protein n=1 Tax=Microbispora rosea TaxID=58117 RepID=UPI0037B62207